MLFLCGFLTNGERNVFAGKPIKHKNRFSESGNCHVVVHSPKFVFTARNGRRTNAYFIKKYLGNARVRITDFAIKKAPLPRNGARSTQSLFNISPHTSCIMQRYFLGLL